MAKTTKNYKDRPRQTDLFDEIREQMSPEAVAGMAAWLQAASTKDASANRQIAWFRDGLVELLGTDQYNQLCDELGL